MIKDPLFTFDEKEHIYKYDNKVILSVTQVMSDLTDFSNIPKQNMKRAQERGKEVHFAVELYNEFGVTEISDDLKPYFDEYLKFKNEWGFEPRFNELKLYSKKYNYAGTVDSVGEVLLPTEKQLVVVDYKTSANYDFKKTGLQLSAYRQLLKENEIEVNGAILLWLQSDKYKNLIYTAKQLDEMFEDFVVMLKYKNILKYYKN